MKNGSLVGIYKETEVSAEILELATLMLEEATLQLILKSCEVSIAKEIKRATENNKPHPTGLTILKYLGLKFSEPTVQDLFPFYQNLSTLTKMSIEDKLEVIEKLVTKIRRITDDKEDEMVAFLLLGFSPELHDSCVSYLGRNMSLTVKDVLSLSKSKESDTAMFTRTRPWKKNNKNQAGAKPRKPCQACYKIHFVSECPAFKATSPDSGSGRRNVLSRDNNHIAAEGKKVNSGWVS